MILSPLRNTVSLLGKDVKPVITQNFGERPEFYKQYGFQGHEGVDLRARTPTPVFAPIEGKAEVKDTGTRAYGLHVIISNERLRVILAHLKSVEVHTGQNLRLGDLIGLTGDSGSAKGAPHLHMTVMKMNGPQIVDKKNGYGGGINVSKYIVCWRETLIS